MIHMLNQVTNNMLLEHQKRQARSGGNQGYRQSLEKRLKCSVCHWWWDQSHIFLLRQLMVHAKLLQSCLTLCNPMDCSHQALLSMGFSRQEYRSGLPCLPPGDLPDPGAESETADAPLQKKSSFSAEFAVILTRPLWNPSRSALPFWDAEARHVLPSQTPVRETCSTWPWALCGTQAFICYGPCWNSNPNTLVFGDGVFGR